MRTTRRALRDQILDRIATSLALTRALARARSPRAIDRSVSQIDRKEDAARSFSHSPFLALTLTFSLSRSFSLLHFLSLARVHQQQQPQTRETTNKMASTLREVCVREIEIERVCVRERDRERRGGHLCAHRLLVCSIRSGPLVFALALAPALALAVNPHERFTLAVVLARAVARTLSNALAFDSPHAIGSDRIGSDRIGLDRIRSDRIGSARAQAQALISHPQLHLRARLLLLLRQGLRQVKGYSDVVFVRRVRVA